MLHIWSKYLYTKGINKTDNGTRSITQKLTEAKKSKVKKPQPTNNQTELNKNHSQPGKKREEKE